MVSSLQESEVELSAECEAESGKFQSTFEFVYFFLNI